MSENIETFDPLRDEAENNLIEKGLAEKSPKMPSTFSLDIVNRTDWSTILRATNLFGYEVIASLASVINVVQRKLDEDEVIGISIQIEKENN